MEDGGMYGSDLIESALAVTRAVPALLCLPAVAVGHGRKSTPTRSIPPYLQMMCARSLGQTRPLGRRGLVRLILLVLRHSSGKTSQHSYAFGQVGSGASEMVMCPGQTVRWHISYTLRACMPYLGSSLQSSPR